MLEVKFEVDETNKTIEVEGINFSPNL